jgi:energy-converting hydrogenase A subunit R
MPRVQLDTDCEGPLALNDHAFELCRDFLPSQGDRFFRQVGRFTACQEEVVKKPGCRAGDTLKLILPFLKAAGLTNAQMKYHSLKNLRLMPGAEAAYQFMHRRGLPLFAISNSYRQFAEAVGGKLGFAPERIFATDLDLDRYRLSPGEGEELERLKQEILETPEIVIPPGAAAAADLPGPVQEAMARLERIFSETIPALDIGGIYQEVQPLGGEGKAKALSESLTQSGYGLAEVIYVGDGGTDVNALEAVRAGGGLAVAFNGNSQAIGAAEVAVVADTAWPVALLSAISELWGKDGVLEVAAPETRAKSRALVLPEEVIEPIARGLQTGKVFNIYLAASPGRERVIEESAAMRARLRGEAVAGLG